MHGMLLHEAGDLVGAEATLLEVLEREETSSGKKERRMTARHNLALIYRRQGRPAEAESQWRAVLAEMPDLTAAWLCLAELFLEQGRIADAETILNRLESQGPSEPANRLRARLHLARREFNLTH
jgi:predicted Zn-dependent protease